MAAYDISDDEDFNQECLIDPTNDQREAISMSPWSHYGINDCIGTLKIIYKNADPNRQETVISRGTATVIHINDNNECYLLTAAHNCHGTLKKCNNCLKKTMEDICSNCNVKTKFETPHQLIEAYSIHFARRVFKGNEMGQIIKSYEVDAVYVHDLYSKYPFTRGGYDVAIIQFICNDKDEIDLYKKNCKNIWLTNDISLGDKKVPLHIFGFPGDKYQKKQNGLLCCALYGHATAKKKGNRFQIKTHKKSKEKYIYNEEIDTKSGQSGAVIFACIQEEFNIYGVHTGGTPASKNKNGSYKFGFNVGTFLSKQQMEWIRSKVKNIQIKEKPKDSHDRKLMQFIKEFKLGKMEQQLYDAEISTDFLLSQTKDEINEIAKELTTSIIQQNKFKYAVSQIRKAKTQIEEMSTQEMSEKKEEKKESQKRCKDKYQTIYKSEPQKSCKRKGWHVHRCKLVTLGDTSVGKTSVTIRFVKGQFSEYQESTIIGAAKLEQTVPVGDCTVKFIIWDTAGQERYRSLAPMYYRGAGAAIVIYDITSQESFHRAKSWVNELQCQMSRDVVIALCGNKIDREEEREVSVIDAKQYADDNSLYFIETSAKTNVNIRELFLAVARMLPKEDNTDNNDDGRRRRIVIMDEDSYIPKKKKGGCCN
eukprot:334145_1